MTSPYRQLFFIEGKLLGESPRGLVRVHEELQTPDSQLFFCRYCGEVYARFPILCPDGSTLPWQSNRRMCRKCSPRQRMLTDWPGSIWQSWDHDILAALPVPVLQWEFDRHLESFEKFGVTL